MKKSFHYFRFLKLCRFDPQKTSSRKGFSLVEVLLSLAILSVFMGAAVSLFLSADRGSKVETDYLRASFLMQEGVEALRSIRDANFLNLTDGTHGLSRGVSSYQLVASPDVTANAFTRTIMIVPAYRDANGAIAAQGTIDSQMKTISVRVDFTGLGGITRSVSTSTYLSDSSSAEATHTLLMDFSSTNTTNVSAVETTGPPANNGALKLATTYTPNGFFASSDIGDHANAVETSGNYALVSSEKAQEGLVIVNATNPNALGVVSRTDIGGKGNGVNVLNTIAAVTVEKDTKGLAFVNIANPDAPVLLSTFNVNGSGRDVVMNATTTFVTTNKSEEGLAVVNSTNPRSPQLLATVNIGGEGGAIALYQNFLLIGVKDNGGIKAYDITNPASPQLVAHLALGDGFANGIALSFPYVFVSVENGTKDIYAIRMSDQGSLTILTSLKLTSGGHPNGITVRGNNEAIVGTDDANEGIVILSVADPAAIRVLEYKHVNAKGRAVTIIGNYIGVATETNNKGFILVGAGDEGFAPSGNYISDPVDTGSAATEYLSVRFVTTQPPGSGVSIQLRTADSANGLSSATWSPAYSISPSIVTVPSKRFFQYRANLSGDSNTSPIVDSVTVEYLP